MPYVVGPDGVQVWVPDYPGEPEPGSPGSPAGTPGINIGTGYQMPQIKGLVADPSTGRYIDPITHTYATPAQIAAAQAGQTKAETAYQEQQIATTQRGQDISQQDSIRSAGVAARGQDISAQTAANAQAQSAQQFAESQQFAKEKWLSDQQLQIQQLALQQQTLATTQAQNARNYQIQLKNQQFLEDKFKFDSSLAMTTEARNTQAQLFNQQAQVAGIQMQMAQTTQMANDTNAQLKNATELFNAGKAADVSMFNINAKNHAAEFNATMALDTQKANMDFKQKRDQQLIDVADKISKAAADPGDRGALASLISALGPEGFGSADAAIAKSNGSLITNDSLVPLEAELRTRQNIKNEDPNPFKFTPVTADQASFTPATAAQAPMPNFSGVNVPTPNTTPFDASKFTGLQSAVGAGTNSASPQNFDSTQQGFIANGTTTASTGQQFQSADGTPLTAEQRAQMPDFVIQNLIDTGQIPKMARGGQTSGAYIGDEQGAEMHIPLPDGNRLVIPHNMAANMPNWGNSRSLFTRAGPTTGFGDAPQQSGPTAGFGDAPAQMPWNRVQMPNWGGNTPMPPAGKNEWESIQGLPQLQHLASAVGGLQTTHPELHSLLTNILSGQPPHLAGGGEVTSQGKIVAGPYMGSNDGSDVNIPIKGTNMTVIMPKPKGKGAAKGAKASKLKGYATGGLVDPTTQGASIFENLVPDQNRAMATDFLDQASRRAANGTPFNINHLPTPVGVSSPGTSPYLANLLASLNAIKRGVPEGYFMEQAALDRPVAMSEGTVGRSG